MIGGLVVTHGDVARELVNAALRIIGEQAPLRAVCIDWNEEVGAARRNIEEGIRAVDAGGGVIIMTDMFGGTASNLSLTLLEAGRVEVVTGVNLSMLLKLCSTACSRMSLSEAADTICARGRESIQIPARALRSRPVAGEHDDTSASPSGGAR